MIIYGSIGGGVLLVVGLIVLCVIIRIRRKRKLRETLEREAEIEEDSKDEKISE